MLLGIEICVLNACDGIDMFAAIVQRLISNTSMTVTTMSGQRTMRHPLLAKQEKLLMQLPLMEPAGKSYPTA